MSLRDRINRIYEGAAHPFDKLWVWAKSKHKLRRFTALQHWASDRAHHAAHPAKFWKARKAYAKKVAWLKAHHDTTPPRDGNLLTTLDAHQVPTWIGSVLLSARKSGVWSGSVISGYRSPAYSEQLCYAMCGAPSCPGRCAGRASNHACPPTGTGEPYEGAVDVSDPAGLQRYTRAHGNPLHGNGEMLPADLNHFSRSGR